MTLDYHTPLNHNRALVFTGFVAFPPLVATVVFMFTRFVAFPSFVATMIFMLTCFVPVVSLAFLVTIFIFTMIVTMIMLCKRWNGYADCKSKSRSKAISNQFHLVHLRC
jgi:uncharacterized membrane protein